LNYDGTLVLVPIREYLLRFHNLFFRSGETELQFSGSASHLDLDGFQTAVFNSQAELFVGFVGAVFLKAIAHG
jgi:hypothetical protein